MQQIAYPVNLQVALYGYYNSECSVKDYRANTDVLFFHINSRKMHYMNIESQTISLYFGMNEFP